ncbi:glycosyltransferase family 2 protein [Endobacter medicaginis]|nr:glycosyltransferase family 2 protein [Endobacter medicaginis]MCX5474905.1 glycosyltransferase family 2 protein [Endobacter medicaginis]
MILAPLRLAIVGAVLNEADNIGPVCDEIAATMRGFGPFEVIFTDDGSTDGTLAALEAARARLPELRIISHGERCGKSAALRSAIAASRAEWIGTMDGDGQDDPADILRMLAAAEAWCTAHPGAPAPLVAGVRGRRRRDTVSKRIATKFANGLRRKLLGDGAPDTGCPLKLFRREDFLALPCFEGLHRFLPALFQHYHHALINLDVGNRPRLSGSSKYNNLNRALVGLYDMTGVIWLRRRTRVPRAPREV